MATKGCDSTAHRRSSSIALLQERFRQLQRAKEMRKEKEILRLFSEPSERTNTNINSRPTGLFFHSESLLPHHHHHTSRASSASHHHHHQSSIYLQPNLQGKQGGFQGGEAGPMYVNYIGSTGSSVSSSRTYNNLDDYSDVDTSLHLWKKKRKMIGRENTWFICYIKFICVCTN